MQVWVSALALFALVINVAATVAVFRSTMASRQQRLAQLANIWLVPIFGAVLIGCFHYSVSRKETPRATMLRVEQDYPAVNLYPPHGPGDV
jgi:ABC-type Na+ efflux pump permease subunit